jgi:hypothetical protein
MNRIARSRSGARVTVKSAADMGEHALQDRDGNYTSQTSLFTFKDPFAASRAEGRSTQQLLSRSSLAGKTSVPSSWFWNSKRWDGGIGGFKP